MKNQRPFVYLAVLLVSSGFLSATCRYVGCTLPWLVEDRLFIFRTFDDHLDDILQELHQISGAVVKHDQLAAARAVKCSYVLKRMLPACHATFRLFTEATLPERTAPV